MKPIKLVVVSALVGASIFSFAACQKPPKTVIINIDGVETNLELNKESIPTKPQDPVKEGWIFRGWFLDAAGTVPYNFDKALDAGSTVYAVFDEKEYQVTFVVDGVSDVVTFKWSQTPTYPTPKKDKYVFKTWCLDPTLTQDYTFTAPTTSGMTVYAKFVDAYKVQYAVTPNLDTTEEIETEIVETEKETAPVRPADPRVEGYDFEGWYLDKKLTQEYNFDTVLSEGQTVYAKLVEKKYTVTYAVGRTGDVLSTATYNYWTVPTQPETPVYQGEWFFGWYLDTEYKTSYDFSYTLKEDTTVYAQFVENKEVYTVEDLEAIAQYPAGNYVLMNDITFARETWTPITEFSGKFDGNGYKIYDFSIDTNTSNSGFFVTNNGTIKNLTLEKFIFTSSYGGGGKVGALVGVNNGTVENCTVNNPKVNNNGGITYKNHVISSITSNGTYDAYYGGLIGYSSSTAIVKNCTVIVDMVYDGKVNAAINDGDYSTYSFRVNTYIGGGIGVNEGEVSNLSVTFNLLRKIESTGNKGNTIYVDGQDDWSSYDDYGRADIFVGGAISHNKGTVTKVDVKVNAEFAITKSGYADAYVYVAGVVQENLGTVTESYAIGKLVNESGSVNTMDIGGFVRRNAGKILDCYVDVEIVTNGATGGGYVGGFVATNVNTIERSYVLGSISSLSTGNYVGGFVAYSETNAQIKNSFASVDITASNTYLGAFVGGFAVEASAFSYCYYASDATIMKGEEAYTSVVVSGVNGETEANMFTETFLVGNLYWNYKVSTWVIGGVSAPTLVWQNA